MKDIKDFIASGIIEMYCMGLASDEEKIQVESLAQTNSEIRDEIAAVTEALHLYSVASSKSPAYNLRQQIISGLKSVSVPPLPPLLKNSTVDDWIKYLEQNNISAPDDFNMVHLVDLPGNDKQTTYVVWAKKGAVVEESHDDEDEYLLMVKGHCSVTINGKIGFYNTGDLVYIPKMNVHRAEALSDEVMLLIGQRVAA
jgi:quercetin dioxygenase-like cupin family protein